MSRSKYETHVQPYLRDISKWYEDLNEEQIAKRLGVSLRSFATYKKEHPELIEALQTGRQALVVELKDTLKRKAKGFHYKETKKVIRDVGGVRTQVIEEYEKYSPPDTGAIHLLLKNLDEAWRNDDKETMDLKRQKLEIEKQKAEESNW